MTDGPTDKSIYTKRSNPSEIAVYSTLNRLAEIYNPSLKHTVLPQAIDFDGETSVLRVKFYDGETFNKRWTEENGGLGVGLDLAELIPAVIADLATIDIKHFTENKALASEERLAFDYQTSLDYYSEIARRLRSLGLIEDHELDQINTILAYRQTSEMIVNNGDFYPRNFVKQPSGKLVIIDWDTWNQDGNSPFYMVDHPENVAATIYVHMWGNQPWQIAFLDALLNRFDFDPNSCLLYTSPSPRDATLSRMPSSA